MAVLDRQLRVLAVPKYETQEAPFFRGRLLLEQHPHLLRQFE